MPIVTVDNNAPVEEGMKVWVYPANKKHGGSIQDYTVYRVGHREIEFTLRWGRSWNGAFQPSNKVKLYSSLAAAQKQRDADKAEPRWICKGRFHIASVAAICAYLAHKTGIEERNIDAHKTESGTLYIAWVGTNGLEKTKQHVGTLYSITEAKLEPLVRKMKPCS